MAEVLGPIGFVFGAIGFILRTLPATEQAIYNYRNRGKQIEEHSVCLATFRAKYSVWSQRWGRWVFRDQHNIDAAKKAIENLRKEIEKELDKHRPNITKDERLWGRIKVQLNSGHPPNAQALGLNEKDVARSLHHMIFGKTKGIFWGLLYTLYKKDKLDAWMTRLGKVIDNVVDLSKSEIQDRTAGQIQGDATEEDVTQANQVGEFVLSLRKMAKEVYDRCTWQDGTEGWALGLRPPEEANSVKHWKYAKIHIELVFVLGNEERCLRIDYPRTSRHRELSQIPWRQIIRGPESGSVSGPESALGPSCHVRSPQLKRTPNLGVLFERRLFQDPALEKEWREDRAQLIRGISNWMLLLWSTEWTQALCCYGLCFAKGEDSQNPVKHLFTVRQHNSAKCNHRDLPLRKLGLVLAELILTTPIRLPSNRNSSILERWTDNEGWQKLERREILRDIKDKAGSAAVSEVIEFCLTDQSALAREQCEPESLLRCIEKIYKPLHRWCEIELGDPSWYDVYHRLWVTEHKGWFEQALEIPQAQDCTQNYRIPGAWPEKEGE